MQSAEGADQSSLVENIWRGVWTPDDYTDRNILFYTWPRGIGGAQTAASFWVYDSSQPGIYPFVYTMTFVDSVQIPLAIPSPGFGTLLLAGVGLAAMTRGCRQKTESNTCAESE